MYLASHARNFSSYWWGSTRASYYMYFTCIEKQFDLRGIYRLKNGPTPTQNVHSIIISAGSKELVRSLCTGRFVNFTEKRVQ